MLIVHAQPTFSNYVLFMLCMPCHELTLSTCPRPPCTADIGNYVLFMLRMLTTAEIKGRADFFAPFILVRRCLFITLQ